MRDSNVNVIMISQASSEHSVCFAVKTADTDLALAALNKRWGAQAGGRAGAGRGGRGEPSGRPQAGVRSSTHPTRQHSLLWNSLRLPAFLPSRGHHCTPLDAELFLSLPCHRSNAALTRPSVQGASLLWRRCATAACWRLWARRWPGVCGGRQAGWLGCNGHRPGVLLGGSWGRAVGQKVATWVWAAGRLPGWLQQKAGCGGSSALGAGREGATACPASLLRFGLSRRSLMGKATQWTLPCGLRGAAPWRGSRCTFLHRPLLHPSIPLSPAQPPRRGCHHV